MSALCAWLDRQCDEFVSPTSGNVAQTVPSPVSPPPDRHPVPLPSRLAPAFLPVPQRPFLVHQDQPILLVRLLRFHQIQSIFSVAVLQVPREVIVASSTLVALRHLLVVVVDLS